MRVCLAVCLASVLGCSSSSKVHDVNMTRSPDLRAMSLQLTVDKTKNSPRGEADSLETGLKEQLAKAGYSLSDGPLKMNVEIASYEKGSDAAKAFWGMGAGADVTEVSVNVLDSHGVSVLSFSARGKLKDKRYADMYDVLRVDVSEKIVKQLTRARDQ